MTEITNSRGLPRRAAMQGLAVAGLVGPLVAACGADEAEGPAGADSPSAGSSPAEGSSGSGDSASGENGLTTTAEVAVGGGVIVEKTVITQPTAGEFVGWSAVCPHQKCTFTEVANGRIRCGGCHQAEFDAATGKNLIGPGGSSPSLPDLEAVALTVDGDTISRA